MFMFVLFTHTDGKVDNLDNDLFSRRHSSSSTPPKRRGVRSFVRSFVRRDDDDERFRLGFIDVRLSGWSVHLCVLGVSRIWIGLLSTEN